MTIQINNEDELKEERDNLKTEVDRLEYELYQANKNKNLSNNQEDSTSVEE